MSTQAPPAGGAPSQPAAAPEAPKAPIKPIKTAYPGLVDFANDPQDEVIKRVKAAKGAPKVAPEGDAHLDPAITDGSAPEPAKQTQPKAATDKAELASAPDPATKAAPSDPGAEPFEFAGEKYESREKAEHSIKTLKGMFKANAQRADKESGLAKGWYEAYQKLEAENKLLKQGAQPAPDAKPTNGSPQPVAAKPASDTVGELLEAVNPKVFEQIRERSGDTTAIIWALSKLAELQDKRHTLALDSRFKPVEEQTQASQAVKRIMDTFQGVASLTDEVSGDSLYPEFRDPKFLEATLHCWRALDMSESTAYSHKGVHAAYLAAKDWFNRSGIKIAGSNPTPAPVVPSPASAEAVDKVADAVAAGLNGRRSDPGVIGSSTAHPLRPVPASAGAEADVIKRILAAGNIHPVLGVEITR